MQIIHGFRIKFHPDSYVEEVPSSLNDLDGLRSAYFGDTEADFREESVEFLLVGEFDVGEDEVEFEVGLGGLFVEGEAGGGFGGQGVGVGRMGGRVARVVMRVGAGVSVGVGVVSGVGVKVVGTGVGVQVGAPVEDLFRRHIEIYIIIDLKEVYYKC